MLMAEHTHCLPRQCSFVKHKAGKAAFVDALLSPLKRSACFSGSAVRLSMPPASPDDLSRYLHLQRAPCLSRRRACHTVINIRTIHHWQDQVGGWVIENGWVVGKIQESVHPLIMHTGQRKTPWPVGANHRNTH